MPKPSQLYPVANRTEIDLRLELTRMFHGGPFEIPKARPMILRRMRRDDNNELILAPSVDDLTNEPDLDTYDPYSQGERYLWDEELVAGRRVVGKSTTAGLANKTRFMEAGELNTWTVVFFLEEHHNPTHYDRIVELALDNEGDPVKPYARRRIYRPQSVVDFRSDNGRVEFWGLFCSEKDAISWDDVILMSKKS
jgi:hypothetical protein